MKSIQRGNTVMGLILGIVVGLAVALGVALYVTKTPAPFNDKNQPRSDRHDADEAAKNQGWDPNAPLAGKVPPPKAVAVVPAPADSAAPSVVQTTPVAPPAATPVPALSEDEKAKAEAKRKTEEKKKLDEANTKATANPTPDKTADKAADKPADKKEEAKKPTADPLGDWVKSREPKDSKTGAEAALDKKPVEPFAYFVQAGAFRHAEDAEAQRAKLSLMGVVARVSEREQAGQTVYRVRVGPYNTQEAAERTRDNLVSNGLDATLVRVQR